MVFYRKSISVGRVTPTREYVQLLAKELLGDGIQPTQARIRELLLSRYNLKSSPNVVLDELSLIRTEAANLSQTPSQLGEPPSPPSQLNRLTEELWNSAVLVAKQQLKIQTPHEAAQESLSLQLLEEANQAVTIKTEQIEELRQNLDNEKNKAEVALRAISELKFALSVKEDELTSKRELLSILEKKHEKHVGDLKALFESQIAQLTAEKTREFEMWAGMRKYLMEETDRIRQKHGSEVAYLNEKLESVSLYEEQWRRKANKYSEELGDAKLRASLAEEKLKNLTPAELEIINSYDRPAVRVMNTEDIEPE